LVGLILGIVAMNKVKKSEGRLKGHGLALAGVIVSAVSLLLIPIFAAILLPAFAKGKQKAQAILCITRVNMLEMSLRSYAGTHQNQLPAATNWCDVLVEANPAVTNLMRCPVNLSDGRCSYAMNAAVAGADLEKVDPMTVLLFESTGGWNKAGGKELLPASPFHEHLFVVGYADGHAEMVKETSLSGLRWNP
jgi:hypothetical protein